VGRAEPVGAAQEVVDRNRHRDQPARAGSARQPGGARDRLRAARGARCRAWAHELRTSPAHARHPDPGGARRRHERAGTDRGPSGVTLTHAPKGPLTWWIFEPRDTLTVVCSQGHRSYVLHYVEPDGSIIPPEGKQPSMHCGSCNEDLPLVLDGWPADESYRGPRPERLPPLVTCVGCGFQDRFLGGWGM